MSPNVYFKYINIFRFAVNISLYIYLQRRKRQQLNECRAAKKRAERTLRDLDERGIRPFQEQALLAKKEQELADIQLVCDKLAAACEDLSNEVEHLRRTADQKIEEA